MFSNFSKTSVEPAEQAGSPLPIRRVISTSKTLSVMPTYTCTASCANCASLSSPKERTRLSGETILNSIRQARKLNFGNVVFTGGEATLRWTDLLAGIHLATELDMSTRIVTNAHWAKSRTTAAKRLQLLINAGLTEINLSTGDEHVKFVPLERVANAAAESLQAALPVAVMIEVHGDRTVTRESLENHSVFDDIDPKLRKQLKIVESPWMPLNPSEHVHYPPGVAMDQVTLPGHVGCESVLQTYLIQADGRIGSCCGIGMRLIPELTVAHMSDGDLALENAVDEAESDFLKLWLRTDGPGRILEWAATKDKSIQWEGMYAHNCQACAHLYKDPKVAKVIRRHHKEVVHHVISTAWLDDVLAPQVVKAALEPEKNCKAQQT